MCSRSQDKDHKEAGGGEESSLGKSGKKIWWDKGTKLWKVQERVWIERVQRKPEKN